MKLVTINGKTRWVPDAILNAIENANNVVDNDEPTADDNSEESEDSEEDEMDSLCCPHCGKVYVNETSLKKHIANKHGDLSE